ncbi:hypothetical protein BHE74_00028836 [Ensete ventricosum]|nr:hypothetical protein BHE74_00028836 [Ensete ventricosum]RZS13727.1 hypothetical protein BHM03_00045341 [Ensete ventricosum]
MSISPKRLRVLAMLHKAQLDPLCFYNKCFCVCLSRSDTTMSHSDTHAYPSAKVSLPRDLLRSLRLTNEKMGQKKQF